MSLISTVRTVPSPMEFCRALLVEWPEATKEGSGVLYSQFAGETGDGKFCWNWNLGNVKAPNTANQHADIDYVSLVGVWEGFSFKDENHDGFINEQDRVMFIARMVQTGYWREDMDQSHQSAVGASRVSLIATQKNAAAWFLAFDSLNDGMHRYVQDRKYGHWASTWPFIEAGDVRGYAQALGKMHYYTTSPESYAAALVQKYDKWIKSKAYEQVKSVLFTDFDIVHKNDLPEQPERNGDNE